MRITVLGAGGSYPPPGYGGPCILFEHKSDMLLVEAGEACLPRLESHGIHPCSIRRVFVSHSHIDHWAGLPSIAIARDVEKCGEPLEVVAPWRNLDEIPSVLGHLEERGRITIKEFADTLGGLSLEPVRVRHSVPTYGLRVANEGETIAFYTGDTLYYPDLAREARGARVLLAEATLPREIDPEKAGMHMSVADTLRLASESGAGMLILLHLTPESLEEAVGLESPAHMPVLFGEGYSIIV